MSNEGEDLKSHSEIVQRFVSMRDGVEALSSKINELRNEVSEHEQVLKALEPMEPSRKCFRLIGDVLVERTVEEVIPDVKQNEAGLREVLSKLTVKLDQDQQALTAFQKRYNIRVKGESVADDDKKEDKTEASSSGVLVSSS